MKDNIFNLINFALLVYVLFELNDVRNLAQATNTEAEMSNLKLDYVESDINQKSYPDSNK
ncbi:MAG: hypothetical protein SFY32_08320 [Bacteroidota bacterium]|nr:hypothetical protein [Bacteroidota bacterium]